MTPNLAGVRATLDRAGHLDDFKALFKGQLAFLKHVLDRSELATNKRPQPREADPTRDQLCHLRKLKNLDNKHRTIFIIDKRMRVSWRDGEQR